MEKKSRGRERESERERGERERERERERGGGEKVYFYICFVICDYITPYKNMTYVFHLPCILNMFRTAMDLHIITVFVPALYFILNCQIDNSNDDDFYFLKQPFWCMDMINIT